MREESANYVVIAFATIISSSLSVSSLVTDVEKLGGTRSAAGVGGHRELGVCEHA